MSNMDEIQEQKTQEKEALHRALVRLKTNAAKLCEAAGKDKIFLEEFWNGLCDTDGMLREFAYYCDTGKFLCKKKVSGYTLADVMVWQVDHFKAYLDRGEDCLRYDSPKLLLAAFDIMMKMEKNPEPYLKKMQQESGTDSPDAMY